MGGNMPTPEEKNEALFAQLILTFQTAAYQQMGKLKNPMTDQVEANLDQARFSIDILDMIRTKTMGNLSDNEEKFINQVISELQMNFVAESGKPQETPSDEKEEKENNSDEDREESEGSPEEEINEDK